MKECEGCGEELPEYSLTLGLCESCLWDEEEDEDEEDDEEGAADPP